MHQNDLLISSKYLNTCTWPDGKSNDLGGLGVGLEQDKRSGSFVGKLFFFYSDQNLEGEG